MENAGSPASSRGNFRTTATLALSMLLASLGTSIANIALPALAEGFAAPFQHVQWVVIAYLAAMTVSTVFVGRLGDLYGLRRMFLAGVILFAVASLLCGLASDLWLLIAARVLQGVSAAFLMTLTIALVRQTMGKERIGRAMGLLGTMSALGTALGPSLGGVLVSTTGWRGIFMVQVPLALLALVLAFASLPRDQSKSKARPLGMDALVVRELLPGLSVNVLVAAVMMTTLVVGPFYLGLRLGLSATSMGLVMSIGPLISIVSGIPSGRAADAWGAGRVLWIGQILLAAGAFALSVLPGTLGVAGYVVAIVILTPGYQLFQASNNTVVMADVPEDRRGVVAGLLSLSRNIGLILGASVMGAIFAFGVGTGEFEQASPVAIESGMRLTFIIAGGLMVAALWIACRRSSGRPCR